MKLFIIGIGFIAATFNIANANSLTEFMSDLEPREATYFPLDNNGHFNISCKFSCDIDKELKNVFSFYDTYTSASQVFNFFEGEQFIRSITLGEYLEEYYPNARRSSNSAIPGLVQTFDMPLDCRYDPDFSCEQWMKSDLVDYLVNKKLEFKVTQDFIDGNEAAIRIGISLLTANAISKIAARVGAALRTAVPEHLVTAASATVLSEVLSKLDINSLNAGDTLVFKGGRIIEVRSSSSEGNGSGGSEGGNWDGIREEEPLICVTVFTNSGGGDVPQTVCY
jgi:hypothetical protein